MGEALQGNMECSGISRICISCLQIQFRRIRSLERTSAKVCGNRVWLCPRPTATRMASVDCCKRFSYNYLGFSGESVQRFTLPQAKWPLAPVLWSLFRTFLAVYMVVWLILILMAWGKPPYYSVADSKAKWLIYVSNWSFLVHTLYLIVMAIGNIYYHIRHGWKNVKVSTEDVEPESNSPDHEGMIPLASVRSPHAAATAEDEPREPLPWYFKFAWYLQCMSFTSGIFVALNFYLLVFNPATSTLTAYNFHVHGVNLIVILLDLCLSATPMRVLHLIYPATFSFVYFMFTLVYQKAGGLNEFGGTAIYPKYLDWGTVPGTSAIIMTLVVLVAAPVLHMLWYALYRIRDAISKRCTGCCWSY